jgi:hypothetical protein
MPGGGPEGGGGGGSSLSQYYRNWISSGLACRLLKAAWLRGNARRRAAADRGGRAGHKIVDAHKKSIAQEGSANA